MGQYHHDFNNIEKKDIPRIECKEIHISSKVCTSFEENIQGQQDHQSTKISHNLCKEFIFPEENNEENNGHDHAKYDFSIFKNHNGGKSIGHKDRFLVLVVKKEKGKKKLCIYHRPFKEVA